MSTPLKNNPLYGKYHDLKIFVFSIIIHTCIKIWTTYRICVRSFFEGNNFLRILWILGLSSKIKNHKLHGEYGQWPGEIGNP